MKQLIKDLLLNKRDYLTSGQRTTHTYVIGQPGVGKSRAIESWVMQDIASGNGVGVIDPHGDLFHNLVNRISAMPDVWPRVIILDPCNPKWTVSFNPLGAIRGINEDRVAHFLTDIIVKIWKLDVSNTPRMIWLLKNSFLALSNLRMTLLDLPRFLLDTSFRENLLPQLQNLHVRDYFTYEYPKNQGAIHQWVTPVLNKLGALIFDPDIRLILAGESTINFRQVIDRKLILLVNLPKGILGEGSSALLGAFIVAHIQKAALSRSGSRLRNPFYLYLDEFQNYTTDNIKDILSESRKYALSLTLAHQYLDQLSPEMRSAVLNTAGILICFRVGYTDAYRMAKEVFPSPDFLFDIERGYKIERIESFPLLVVDEQRKPMGWEGLAQVLTKLPPREFWCRRRGDFKPTKHRTFDMPIPKITPQIRTNRRDLLDLSGQLYGRPKQDVKRELERRYKSNRDNTAQHNAESNSRFENGGEIIWGN